METAVKVKNYKTVCIKLGIVMSIFFISGMVCSLLMNVISLNVNITSETTAYTLTLFMSGAFLYIIPIIAAAVILKDENRSKLSSYYKKPARLAKAIGNFPAMYGLGQLTNIVVLLVAWFVTKFIIEAGVAEQQETIERSFRTMDALTPPNFTCAVILFIHMVFAAAIFEELFCRGFLLDALKPYGNGFAIIVTGFLFGIMHGNFQQFFYTFVLGMVLAYITVQTGSILAATILHAMFNSLAAIMMLFLSTQTIEHYFAGIPHEIAENEVVMAGFAMYLVFFLGLLIVGVVLAIKKLTRLKAYKVSNPFTEISGAKKALIFFTSVPVLIMLALTADRFAGGFVVSFVVERL